ncbi:unnamed protein product, partial [Cladocopium goreaui]
MLNSHCIPTTEGQAKKAGAPRLVVDSVKDRSLIKMAGNAMSLPCDQADMQALAASCLLLEVDKPSEGWPLLTDWLRTAGDVWCLGYEAHRAPIEVRPLENVLGLEMKPASLVPTKGVGRATVILFGICYTYCKMRDMEDPELKDFKRFLMSVKVVQYVLMPACPAAVINYRRIQVTEQQSEKQKMNLLQKCLIFTHRATELTLEVGVCELAWKMIEKHLHKHRFSDSAFCSATLSNAQWLVGAAPSSGCNAVWHQILSVTEAKQVLFMRRVLFLHDRAVRRGGRAASVRLSIAERMCVMQHILHEMSLAADHNGEGIFEPGTTDKVAKRAVDGDYNNELQELLTLKDSNFQPHCLQMWTENVCKKAPPPEVSFQAVDDEISKLDKDARESAFRQDVLKLTRDCAQLGMLYKSMVNHEKAVRIQKVTHLKQQNTIGANFIRRFMSLNMKHVAGRLGELEAATDEFVNSVSKLDKFAGLLVWLDFTKFGRLSNTDLNETLELLQLALSRIPDRAAAFVICPHLISEKVAVQGNLRGELRT